MLNPSNSDAPPQPSIQTVSLAPIVSNAFRVLGTSGVATRDDVNRSVGTLKRRLRLGTAPKSDWDAPWLADVERTEGRLLEALGRVTQIESRLRERGFWFWTSPDSSSGGPSSAGLAPAIDAEHDEALRLLAHASAADPGFDDAAGWRRAIDTWRRVVGDERFADRLLAIEREGGFEPVADAQDVAPAAAALQEAVARLLADAAKDALAAGNDLKVVRVLAILHAAVDPEHAFAIDASIVATLEAGVTRLAEQINVECRVERENSDAAAKANRLMCQNAENRFTTEVQPRLARLETITGKDSIFSLRARGAFAVAMSGVASDWTWANEWVRSEDLLKRATQLAAGTPAEGRISEQQGKVKDNAQIQREGIKPAKGGPWMFTINGCGFRIMTFGNKFFADASMEYATYYFTILWIPIVPLRRYLVSSAGGNSWYFHATVNFGKGQWIHLAIGIALIASFLIWAFSSASVPST